MIGNVRYIVLAVLVVLSPSVSHALAQDDEGLLDAARSNVAAWSTGDVLVRYSLDFDGLDEKPEGGPGGAIVRTEGLVRTVFDYRELRFAQLYMQKESVTNYEAKVFDPVETIRWGGVCIDFKKGRGFANGSNLRNPTSYSKEQLPTLLSNASIRDYRATCLVGGERFGNNMPQIESEVLKFQSELTKTTSLDDGVEYWRSKRYEKQEKKAANVPILTSSNEVITIDRELFAPVKRKVFFSVLLGNDRVTYLAECDWKSIDGIAVPVKLRTNGGTRILVGGKPIFGEQSQQFDFHWFEINNELEDEWFDGSRTVSREKILEHLLPEKTGADTLLSTSEEEGRRKRRKE